MSKIDVQKAKSDLEDASRALLAANRAFKIADSTFRKAQLACDHVYGSPYPGYEHEGANCTICGINELHAMTLKEQNAR